MLLWDVDTQIDFLLPEGRLYVPGAELIIPNLARLTAYAADNHFPLVSSACAHQSGDPELATFGPHCMVGTPGQQKVPETLLPQACVVPNHAADLPAPAACRQIIVEKQDFDVFTNPNAEELLRKLGADLHIVLYGVVTEICVAAAARGLLQRGHRVALVTDAVRALDATQAGDFVQGFLRQGGQLMTTDELLKPTAPALAA